MSGKQSQSNNTANDSGKQHQLITELKSSKELLEKKLDFLQKKVEILDQQRGSLADVTEKMNMIAKLSREINALEFERIVDVCVNKVPLLVNATYASLFLYDYDQDELILERHNHPEKFSRKVHLKVDHNTLLGYVTKHKEMILVRNIDEFEKTRGIKFERPFAEKYKTGSCVVTPLRAGNRVVGVLCLADRSDGLPFSEIRDTLPIQQLSDLIGTSLRNVQLFEEVKKQASLDVMTNLANHHTFMTVLKSEVDRAGRYKNPLSLIIIDVDHFKNFNDEYGHQVGDYILRETARIIRSQVRNVDTAARYGGDEFVVILPETAVKGAKVVASRAYEKIRSKQFQKDQQFFKVTVTMGIAQFRDGMRLSDLIQASDEALYAAKRAGRDRIQIYEAVEK